MRNRIEKHLALFPLALFCTGVALFALDSEIHDFANYYFGAYSLGNGGLDSQIYFPYHFNQMIVSLGHEPIFAGFAPNTPFLALVILPFTILSPLVAKFAFNIVSIGLFLITLKRLADFYKIRPVFLLVIPLLFFVPLKNELLFGQVYLLVFFFISESWLADEKGQQIKSGIFLALAIMLKVFPVLLVLPLLFQKRYMAIFSAFASCGILVLATLPLCSFETWVFYLTDVLPKASNGGIASAYVDNYQSYYMFFKRIFVLESVENRAGLLNWPRFFGGLMVSLKVFLVAIGFFVTRKVENRLFVISYWMLAIILISPYGSTYTFILMLFPFFAIAKADIKKRKKPILLALLFLACNFPLSLFLACVFPLNYLRLFFLVGFFAILLSIFKKSVNWKIASGVAIAALLLFMPNKRAQPAYFLENSPLLVYDYLIENDQLSYKYWDENGAHSTSVPIKITSSARADLTRNEIYYLGKLIHSDDGHKQKPVVINRNTLLYLSDEDRGIGFYTLRKIDLP